MPMRRWAGLKARGIGDINSLGMRTASFRAGAWHSVVIHAARREPAAIFLTKKDCLNPRCHVINNYRRDRFFELRLACPPIKGFQLMAMDCALRIGA